MYLFLAVEQTHEMLTTEIQRAHVVCVVYAVNDEESLEKVSTYWLPLLRDVPLTEHYRPVVLVGNKMDLVDFTSADVRYLA